MVPTIGVMIGAYIFTRMIEIFGRKDRGTGLKVMAGITMVVVVISVIDLLSRGVRTPPM